MDNTLFLIATLVSAIILVILLIMKARLHAFISLVIACFYVGILTGMPLLKICSSIEAGMGSTLGFLATVLGLGSILGKMLEESGGAERLARTLINTLGKKTCKLGNDDRWFTHRYSSFLSSRICFTNTISYKCG